MKWLNYILGNQLNLTLEKRLLIIISLSGALLSFIAIIINFFLVLGFWIQVVVISGIILLGSLYYLLRFQKYHEIYKWFATFIGFVYIDFLWFVNNGSFGPIPYLFVIVFISFIFIWRGWKLAVIMLFFALNFYSLFYIEYHYPNIIVPYANLETRFLDFYLGFTLYLGMILALVMFARNVYVKEKELAENADRLKSAFLENMSHEIRTPMNAIMGFAGLLRRKNLDEKRRENYIEIINNSGTYLLQLINDIIDYSKIEANVVELNIKNTDIHILLNELKLTVDQLLQKYEKSNILFSYSILKPDFELFTDANRLRQILYNLIVNAIKFTETGTIKLNCIIEKERVLFSVKDTGIGIEASYKDKIFERFVKVDKHSNNKLYRGTGLGLSISKYLVEKLGGEIWVDSTIGEGSEFCFFIPVIAVDSNISDMNLKSYAYNKINFDSKRILIVEDEEQNISLLYEYLEPTNINLSFVKTGAEVLEIVKKYSFDIILMDIKLPDISGAEVLKQIRELNYKKPIIAQTAFALIGDSEKFIKIGFTDCISKPYGEEQLLELLKKYL